MRSIIGLLASITMAFSFGGNFFTLSYTALNGSTVNTSAYTGKKVIVFAFNGSHPDIAMLHILDSLQRAKGDSIQVLGFPALEWDSAVTVQKLTHLRDSMGLTIALAQPARVQKGSGVMQHPVFQWLTSTQGNGHFNRNVEEEGMLFIINKNGELYSIINRGLYARVLPRVL